MLKCIAITLAVALLVLNVNGFDQNVGRKSNRAALLSKAVGARMLSNVGPQSNSMSLVQDPRGMDQSGQFVSIARHLSPLQQQFDQGNQQQVNNLFTPDQLQQLQAFSNQQAQIVQTPVTKPTFAGEQQQQQQQLQQQQHLQDQQLQQQQLQQQQHQQLQQQQLQQQQVQQQQLNQKPVQVQQQVAQGSELEQQLLEQQLLTQNLQEQLRNLQQQQRQQQQTQQVQQLPVQQLPVQQQVVQQPVQSIQQQQQLQQQQLQQQQIQQQQLQQQQHLQEQQLQQQQLQQQQQQQLQHQKLQQQQLQQQQVQQQQLQQRPVQQLVQQQLPLVQQQQQQQGNLGRIQQQVRVSAIPLSEDICANAQPGDLIPHPSEQNQFVICYGFGEFTVMECPEMLIYNPHLKRCDLNAEVPLLCKSNPCLNNGKCVELNNFQFKCECRAGFAGNTCEKLDTCSAKPCGADGACISFPMGSPIAHVCLCNGGRSIGSSCQRVEQNPCLAQGTNTRLLPVSLNPSVFVHCEGSRPHFKFCQPPLIFAVDKQACDWS